MILNAFQLRTARSVLTFGVREIGSIIGISRSTVSILENQKNFEPIKIDQQRNDILVKFFKEKGVHFPNTKSIALGVDIHNKSNLLTRFQIRVARIAMNLTQDELAKAVGMPLLLLNYLEKQQNKIYISATPKVIDEALLRRFFETNGIQFLDECCVYLEQDPRELLNNY